MEVPRFPAFLSTAFRTLTNRLDARIRERVLKIFAGMFLASDVRRTASKWFRAGIGAEFKSAYNHVAAVGRRPAARPRLANIPPRLRKAARIGVLNWEDGRKCRTT